VLGNFERLQALDCLGVQAVGGQLFRFSQFGGEESLAAPQLIGQVGAATAAVLLGCGIRLTATQTRLPQSRAARSAELPVGTVIAVACGAF